MGFLSFSDVGSTGGLEERSADSSSYNEEGRTLSDLFNAEEPQRTYMWEVELEGGADADVLSLYARATAVPTRLMEQMQRYYCGVGHFFIGRDNSPRVFRITFFDDENMSVSRFIENWMISNSYGEDRKMVAPKNYHRNIKLKLKDSTDNIVTRELSFIDCYPIEKSETSLTFESSELFTFDVMFAYRKQE